MTVKCISKIRKKARDIYIEMYGLPTCNHCGSIPADVHHLNEDIHDNSKDNLIALCRSCHMAYHNHVSPKRPPKKCKVCGKKHLARGLCSKHYEYSRRRGFVSEFTDIQPSL